MARSRIAEGAQRHKGRKHVNSEPGEVSVHRWKFRQAIQVSPHIVGDGVRRVDNRLDAPITIE
jgi:hypothetical protein